MPAKPYVLVGTYTNEDGVKISLRTTTGSANPEDVQYKRAQQRIASMADTAAHITYRIERK